LLRTEKSKKENEGMKWAGVIVPIILAIVAGLKVPLGVWIEMNQGLLAFLGLLAAALVQVIPVTANFLQSDRLTPQEAVRLSDQLMKQQRYWLGLLVGTVVTFVIVVVVSVFKDKTVWDLGRLGYIDVGPYFSGLVALSLVFVIFKMTAIVSGVMSLQTLRNELVLNSANRAAAEEIERLQERQRATLQQGIVPPDYGSIIHPH
jgi:signal transduction histidine kinase